VLSGKENETAMRCVQYNKLIYLYSELEANEKQDVNAHLRTCKHCQLYFEQRQSDQHFLKSIFRVSSVQVNSLLTDKIMASIPAKSIRKSDTIELIFGFLQRSPIRYALASASVSLCIFFMFELRPMSNRNQNKTSHNDTDSLLKDAKLNAVNLYELSRHSSSSSVVINHSKTLSIYECVLDCRNKNYKNCEECKAKYLNIKGYEGI
jgi:hypothetical protein